MADGGSSNLSALTSDSQAYGFLEYFLRLSLQTSTTRIVEAWEVSNPQLTMQFQRRARETLTLDSWIDARTLADEAQVVSAGLFTHFNRLVYHTLSGHGEEALRTQAPTLLLWETIKRYKAEGAERFNFGGCPVSAADEANPSHGVYVYKMGFGGRRYECTSGHKVLRKAAYGAMRGLRRLLRR